MFIMQKKCSSASANSNNTVVFTVSLVTSILLLGYYQSIATYYLIQEFLWKQLCNKEARRNWLSRHGANRIVMPLEA